jgi:N-acetylmuramoyl-L-alanine amidase
MKYIVYLDDGHGMETAGKRTPPIPELNNRVIRENEFNRVVVADMKVILERSGMEVVLTAPTDRDHPLDERVRTVNTHYRNALSKYGEANVKAIVCSIHYNAFDGKFDGNDPEGLSVFHHTGSTEGNKLAKLVHAELVKGTPQRDRGVKNENFYILKYTIPPAILTENGFMDNKKEALRMLDEDFIDEVAMETCDGIANYFGVKIVAPNEDRVKAPEGKIYRVQIGGFSYKDNADRLAELAKAKGFNVIVKLEDR